MDYQSQPSDPPRPHRHGAARLVAGGLCVVGAGLAGVAGALFFGFGALTNTHELYLLGAIDLAIAVTLLGMGVLRVRAQ